MGDDEDDSIVSKRVRDLKKKLGLKSAKDALG